MAYYVRSKTVTSIVSTLPEGCSLHAAALEPLPLSQQPVLKEGDCILHIRYSKKPIFYVVKKNEPTRAELLRFPIHYLALRSRVQNSLAQLGIATVGDLIKKTRYNLLERPYFGKACLDEVVNTLAKHGLHLTA